MALIYKVPNRVRAKVRLILKRVATSDQYKQDNELIFK